MNDEERQKLIEQARAMQEQAAALLAAAEADEDSAAPDEAEDADATTEPRSGDEVNDGAAEQTVDEPDDSEEAKVDPPEVMDMREELDKVRKLIGSRGFVRKASSAEGEVWEKPGPRGEPGFRATFVSTPYGRIRLEIRNPGGLMVTQAEPATLIDSEIALQHVP
jgi:hypothetical protein